MICSSSCAIHTIYSKITTGPLAHLPQTPSLHPPRSGRPAPRPTSLSWESYKNPRRLVAPGTMKGRICARGACKGQSQQTKFVLSLKREKKHALETGRDQRGALKPSVPELETFRNPDPGTLRSPAFLGQNSPNPNPPSPWDIPPLAYFHPHDPGQPLGPREEAPLLRGLLLFLPISSANWAVIPSHSTPNTFSVF